MTANRLQRLNVMSRGSRMMVRDAEALPEQPPERVATFYGRHIVGEPDEEGMLHVYMMTQEPLARGTSGDGTLGAMAGERPEVSLEFLRKVEAEHKAAAEANAARYQSGQLTPRRGMSHPYVTGASSEPDPGVAGTTVPIRGTSRDGQMTVARLQAINEAHRASEAARNAALRTPGPSERRR